MSSREEIFKELEEYIKGKGKYMTRETQKEYITKFKRLKAPGTKLGYTGTSGVLKDAIDELSSGTPIQSNFLHIQNILQQFGILIII